MQGNIGIFLYFLQQKTGGVRGERNLVVEIRKLGAKSETTSKRGRYFFPSDFSYFSRKLPRQYTSNNLFSGNVPNICYGAKL